jgi:hypothetical protein
MDILVVNQFLDTLTKSADLVLKVQEIMMNFSMPDQIRLIHKKLDQEIIGKMNSAFHSIEDALITNNPQVRKDSLDDARVFFKGTNELDLTISTAGRSNAEIVAISNYGLSIVYKLLNDDRLAEKYILLAFRDGPNYTRKVLAPGLFNSLFEPKCADLATWYYSQYQIFENKDYSSDVTKAKTLAQLEKAGAAGAAAVSFLADLASLGRFHGALGPAVVTAGESMNEAQQKSDSIVPDNFRSRDQYLLLVEYENRIDRRCREIATGYLSNRPSKSTDLSQFV